MYKRKYMEKLGKILLVNSDNMELMSKYHDNYFSIVITDVPYGLDVGNMAYLKETKTTVKQKNGTRINGNKNKKVYTNKDWDLKPPSQEYFNEVVRVSKHQIIFGVEYVNWEGLGNGRIKWNKGFAEGMSFKPYEMAYCSFIDYVKEIDYLYAGMMQGKSISEPMVQQGNKKLNEKREHPTQKPILLWDLILTFCIENNIDISTILDTNSGLCSLGLSALKFEEVKEIVMCDIDDEYYEKSKNRIKNKISQLEIKFID